MLVSHDQLVQIIFLTMVFFCSMALSVLFTPLADILGRKLGFMDKPCSRKVHTECVSRMGGIAMALAFFLTAVLFIKWNREMLAFFSGAAIIVAMGMADDRKSLSARLKAVIQVLSAVTFILAGQVSLTNLGNILGTGDLGLGFLGPWLTILAVVGVINAFNLADGLDGLAGGMAGIACIFLIPLAFQSQSWTLLLILTALLGTILGFLRYNVYPARLFMGDTGSLLLGFSMAAAAIVLTQDPALSYRHAPVTVLIILSLPIADTIRVMGARIIRRVSVFYPDKNHLHHRLLSLGLSHQASVSVIYGLMFLLGISAWIFHAVPEWIQFYGLICFYVVLYSGLFFVEKRYGRSRDLLFCKWSGKSSRLARSLILFAARNGDKVFFLVWVAFIIPAMIIFVKSSPGLSLYSFFIIFFSVVYYPWMGGRKKMSISHGLIFFNLFAILLIYNIYLNQTAWFMSYMTALAVLSGAWTLARVLSMRRARLLIPASFEIMFLGLALAVPVIIRNYLNIGGDVPEYLLESFWLSLPMFMLSKTFIRRRPSANRKLMLYFMAMLSSFFIIPLVKGFF